MILILVITILLLITGLIILYGACNTKNNYKVFWGTLLIMLMSATMPSIIQKLYTEHKPVVKEIPIHIISEQINFEDSVSIVLKNLRAAHPDIILKQARIESGNFTSKVYRENNNMFGMKYPRKRPTVAIGENRGYAVYNTWQEGVLDYVLWQLYTAKGLERDEYLHHLDMNYAEDTLYIQKIK